MQPPIHIALIAISLFALSACEMEPQPADIEEINARRLALSTEIINDCRATQCARLDLDSRYLPDYGVVANMTHVTAFMASYSDFNNLSDIAAMTQLRELHIGRTQVTDLSGLRNFPNLTLLHLQNGADQDLSPIAGLSRLEELALGNKTIDDLSFLRDLTRLRSLSLVSARITDLSGLRGLRSIETLDLVNAALPDDISALTTLPNLREVSLSDTRMEDSQQAVIDQLKAKGVTILRTPTVIVC